MSPKTRRIFGFILITAAILGWAFSLSGLVAVWVARPSVTNLAVNNVKVIKGALEVTTTGLEASQKSLDAIVSSMETLQGTVQKTANTVEGAAPLIGSLATLADQNLPKTVEGLKNSLATAQQGARVIDEALRKLTDLPIIGGLFNDKPYNPTTPLDKGLSEVADGINNLDETFQGMTDNLNRTRDNVQAVQEDITGIATNIGIVIANLKEAESVLSQYQSTAQAALDFLNKWEGRLPQLITLLSVVISFFLVWVALTQLGLFLQGREYLQLL